MDYIVALGNGMVVLKDNVLDLSPESKITILAAGILYKDKLGQKIVFSGGHTRGKSKESEAKKMFEFIKNKFSIPESDIILEENSIDTAGNAFEVKKLLPENSKVILLSFAYHLPRAKRIFKNYGIYVKKDYASDKVLEENSPLYDEFLKKFTLKRKIEKILGEMFCLLLVYTIDSKGKILRIITSQTRGGSLGFLPF